jgi:hypothetical protein
VSVESETYRGERRSRPSQVVSGYLSAFAIFTGVIAIAWHPLRLAPMAMLIALVAAGMGAKERKGGLALAAVLITAACFFLGMTVAVVTSRPLW